MLTVRGTQDELISGLDIVTRTGRKWSATESVSQAESALKTQSRDNCGWTPRHWCHEVIWSRSDQERRRGMIHSKIRRTEGHARQAKAVQMGAIGAWTTWNTTDRKLTWGDVWKYEPLRLSFKLRSVYDLLPSPANLSRWELIDDPKCSLCDKTGTLEHVLSSCSTSLTDGRYRYRELADWLETEKKKRKSTLQHGSVLHQSE